MPLHHHGLLVHGTRRELQNMGRLVAGEDMTAGWLIQKEIAMPKHNQRAEDKQDQKRQRRAKRVATELANDRASLTDLPGKPIAPAGDGTIQAQAARLRDPQLQSVQRQALAAQIGQVQGNRHLQRVVAFLNRDDTRTAAEEETFQAKEPPGQTPGVTSALEDPSEAVKGSDQPLPEPVRDFFEPRFGDNFSQVRIHTDAQAAEAARAVNARAFTLGRHVVFGAGQYAPETTEGQRLLAHELTHVVQQGGSSTLSRQVSEEAPEEEAEGAEVPAEPIEPFPEATFVSKDFASEEESTEEASVAATPADFTPTTLSPQIIPPDHPSEREAEAVSQAILSGPEKGNNPRIRHIPPAGIKFVQRKIYWEDQNAVTWNDFKGKLPKKSPYDAWIYTGIQPSKPKVSKTATPTGKTCKKGKKTLTEYRAAVGLDISSAVLNVRGYMEPSKSWSRPSKQSPTLLGHEQGHYDIANVLSEAIEMSFVYWGMQHLGEATKCGKKPALNAATKAWNALKANKKLQKITKKGYAQWRQANTDYDTDTGHGTKAAGQKAWQSKIGVGLPGYTDVIRNMGLSGP